MAPRHGWSGSWCKQLHEIPHDHGQLHDTVHGRAQSWHVNAHDACFKMYAQHRQPQPSRQLLRQGGEQACCGARVICLSCGRESDRYEFQEHLKQLNPDAAAAVAQLQKAGADRVSLLLCSWYACMHERSICVHVPCWRACEGWEHACCSFAPALTPVLLEL